VENEQTMKGTDIVHQCYYCALWKYCKTFMHLWRHGMENTYHNRQYW